MVNHFLSKKVDPNSAKGRYAIGKLLGYVGIFLNFTLFLSKFTIGWIVNSVAIKGDAINNLTDFL
ncbi:MAG: cation transporter, partial [Allobaculum sp.]|nr:cation transporter [Allobaculum sp.]